jgi:hypothetical protein
LNSPTLAVELEDPVSPVHVPVLNAPPPLSVSVLTISIRQAAAFVDTLPPPLIVMADLGA